MLKQLVIYVAVICLTAYSYFFYESRIVGLLFVAELIYLPISLFVLFYLRKRVQVSLERVIPLAEKNKEISIEVNVKNNSKLPNVYVRILLETENSATGENEAFYVFCSVKRGKTAKKQILLKSQKCGVIFLSVKKYWIYDLLFLLKTARKSHEMQQMAILPETHLLMVEVTRKTREFIVDSEEYSDRESGDDPSEIYQVREYREGDSIHDVHWKLTAKADELRVKEYGRPMGCVVLVWLNLEKTQKKMKHVPPVLLEAAASLSMSLLEMQCVHMVAWYEPENKQIQKKRISKEAHIYELLNRLLYTTTYEEDVKYQREEAFRGCQFSTVVEFQTDGTILVDNEEKMKLSLKDEEQKWDELYFIV